jgi:excinuclease ABC subunit C
VVFWAVLKWERVADKAGSDRWLIFIAYLMGLSIGVHLLNLLAIPAIVLVYYFRNYTPSTKGVIAAMAASMVILVVVLYGIIPGFVEVAACVVYIKGKPAKKEYRKYNIKTVQGPDDYASMKEVVRRRYTRMLNEDLNLPDLIVADGGVGQMEVIRQVVEDELKLQIPIAGLAKDGKHKTHEVLIGFPPQVVGLKPTDQLFKFFAGMQDEVHRFAITFHREKRSKTQVASELDNIPGIGEKTKNDLIKHFKSVKRIRNAEITELSEIVGTNRSSIIYNYFRANLKP